MHRHAFFRFVPGQQSIFSAQIHAIGTQDQQSRVTIAKGPDITVMACLYTRRLINIAAFEPHFDNTFAQLAAGQDGRRVGIIHA